MKNTHKNTKIVCTIGPASEDKTTLRAMVNAGMDVARLNFSHGSYENHAKLIRIIRAVSKELDQPVAIMQDLQGPKIRIGLLKAPIKLQKNKEIVIGKDFKLDFDLSKWLKPGQRILIEDGLIELRVVRIQKKNIYCRVMNSGLVQSHKGINIPDSKVAFPIITAKDSQDLKFGLKSGVDFVAISFVRGPSDIINAKRLIKKFAGKKREPPLVIAKIEKPQAIENFDEVLKATDAIMIARGDLGVEVLDVEVPILQKKIIEKCLKAGKPVIVATQMLDSMIRNPRPTRAEVNDVENAAIDGADAVMLSGESASGSYPMAAVREMSAAIKKAEQSVYSYAKRGVLPDKKTSAAEAISESVHDLARRIGAKAIIIAAASFGAVTEISHNRPEVPLYVFATNTELLVQLSLVWGVRPVAARSFVSVAALRKGAKDFVKQNKIAKTGDKILVLGNERKTGLFDAIEVLTV